jgi:hypothetical protein
MIRAEALSYMFSGDFSFRHQRGPLGLSKNIKIQKIKDTNHGHGHVISYIINNVFRKFKKEF